MPYIRRSSLRVTAKSAPSLVATLWKPGASSLTLSPWLIQTWYFSPTCHIPSNSVHSVLIFTKARPNSPMSAQHRATELVRHHLLAVAIAEDRNARIVEALGRQRQVGIVDAGRTARQDDS